MPFQFCYNAAQQRTCLAVTPRTTGGRTMEAATFEMVLTARAEVERLDLPRQLAA